MFDKVILNLMSGKEREKFFHALESKFGTDEYVDILREFSENRKGNTRLMNEFRKWMKNKKSY